jgi:phytoene dehydrogenase-like protein
VETDDGRVYKSSTIISNAGIQPTVLLLAGEDHFDGVYVGKIKKLMPSHSLLGYRYFLSEPVIEGAFGVVFSDTSPWTKQRFEDAHAGKASREGVLYIEVPSNYDTGHAPEGKQLVITGSFCPADPKMSKEDIKAWADAGEEILFRVHPELERKIEEKFLYTTKSVANATRDSAVPGAGGETIGIAQIVGQTGKTKPSIKTPVEGLWVVGCDAGAPGVGTQQAINSGYVVAEAVLSEA